MGIHTCGWENERKPAERYCTALMGPVSFFALYSINISNNLYFIKLDQRRHCKVFGPRFGLLKSVVVFLK